MINSIRVEGFKNIDRAEFNLRPFTIITGKNSTGKSSLLQSILLTQYATPAGRMEFKDWILSDFDTARNKYANSKSIKISVRADSDRLEIDWDGDGMRVDYNEGNNLPQLERSLYYLSANRQGMPNLGAVSNSILSGPTGEFLTGTFESEKSRRVTDDIVKYKESYTISSQLNYWLSYIFDIKLELNTERLQTQMVEVKFNSDGLPNILPTQLGAGVGYVSKVLILCLRSQPNDVIMIENPEIHLYPGAQSRLTEFLAFMAAHGRQIIIETHSDVIVTKARHIVFKQLLKSDDVLILFKESITSPFVTIQLDNNGHFIEDFPESFFDATLKELLEMD